MFLKCLTVPYPYHQTLPIQTLKAYFHEFIVKYVFFRRKRGTGGWGRENSADDMVTVVPHLNHQLLFTSLRTEGTACKMKKKKKST